jgi:hypothetical protein
MSYSKLATDKHIHEAADALRANGFDVMLLPTMMEAKEQVLGLIPAGVEVMTMSSETLRISGIAGEINDSERYAATRRKLATMDRKAEHREMQRLGSAPEWSVGSVHAVTRDGHLLIASASGSQIPAHAFGADHVVFVVGCQKIVVDIADGIKRIYEHSLPLENVRAQEAYGQPSSVNQILIMNKQRQGRVTVMLVKEAIGF